MTGRNGACTAGQGYRVPMVVLVFCLGTLAAATLAWWAHTQQRQALETEFQVRAARQSTAIHDHLEEVLAEVEALARLYHVTPHIGRGQFHAFAAPALARHPGIQALEWIPRVGAAQRAEYEAAARADGLAGFRFTERAAGGALVAAGARDDYFPVFYLEPLAGNEAAMGFDLASEPGRRKSLEDARDRGVTQLSAPLTLVQERERQRGFLILSPVYAPGEVPATPQARRAGLRGFALGVVRIGVFMERSMQRIQAQALDVWLLDTQLPAGERVLHFHPSSSRKAGLPLPGEPQARAGLHHEMSISVGGREWALLLAPAPELGAQVRGAAPWLVFVLAWGLTLLLTLYLWRLQQSDQSLRREVRQREQAEERSRVLGLLYRTLSEANQAIIRLHEQEPLLAEICRVAAAHGRVRLALIGLLESAGGALQVAAAAGPARDFVQVLSGAGPALQPLAEAMRVQQRVVCDIRADPVAAPWRAQATALELHAMVAFPLEVEDQVVGVFALYAAEAAFFDEEILALLAELAGDIAFALSGMAQERARRQAEAALRAREREYRTLVDTLPDIIWHKDAGGAYLTCNRAYAAALGIEPAAIAGRSDEDFYPPELAAKYGADDHRVLASGQTLATEESWVRDGQTVWVDTRKVPLLDESGRPVGTLGIARDITERRRMELELRQLNRELGIANRTIALFMTMSDEEMYHEVLRVVLEAMASEYGVFGYLDAEGALVVPSMTRHIWDQCQVADKRIVFPRTSWGQGTWATAIREKRIICVNEPSTLTPPGHVTITRHISLPILYQDEAIGLFQVANKGTEYSEEDVRLLETIANHVAPILSARLQRDAAHAELTRHQEHLEELVAARTAELEGKNRALEAANSDLESFSYSVSHDLRAPLRAIDGFTAILQEDHAAQLDAEGQRLFGVVGENARKMGRLIDDILAFSRAGRHELQVVSLDMTALVREAWEALEPQRAGRAIELKLEDLPPTCGDPGALRQVLQNLLSNAVKFTRERTPAVIEVSGRSEGGDAVYCVRDNGVGFDMAYAAKLFGLFQRLHGMEEFEGTGVGLAIVRRFIVKHGGRVWADGRVGEGAAFWFSLPAAGACEPSTGG